MWYEKNMNLDIEWYFDNFGKKICVDNIMCFDIETTSGIRIGDKVNLADFSLSVKDGEPMRLMYVWQIAIESGDEIKVFMGRTWEEFKSFVEDLTNQAMRCYAGISLDYEISDSMRKKMKKLDFNIYIHNLSYEFQFLRNVFSFIEKGVFAREQRKPMKATFKVNDNKIVLHDTLALTQKSLYAWGVDEKLEVIKKPEPQEYYMKMRTPLTPLTDEEIEYSEKDVITMVYGIKKFRSSYRYLYNIPMTQTGIVRRKCISEIALRDKEWAENCKQITRGYSWDLYQHLHTLFIGGWTHANMLYSGRTVKNVKCFDFRSSYPAVMVTRKFPVGPFELCDNSELDELLKGDINDRDFNFYIKFKATNIFSTTFNTLWSSSKTLEMKNPITDNGKILSCDMVECIMTDLDFDLFLKTYNYDELTPIFIYKSKSGYLPRQMINVVLDYYGYKTSLKGDETALSKYNESKQFINSIYGASVTKIVSDTIRFSEGDWFKKTADEDDFYLRIEKDTKKECWTTYQIGCWITAWARHNLWDAILKFDKKIVYCDTDSVKGLFTDDDLKWFDEYNKGIDELIEKVSDYYNMDVNLWKPKTRKNTLKEIGYFDREDDCVEFKTLGAKKYVDTILKPIEKIKKNDKVIEYIEKNGVKYGKVLQATISGISKHNACLLIDTVDDFNDDLSWSSEESGKLISYYNDNQTSATWVDYNGVEYVSDDKYGIALVPTTFEVSVADEYSALLSLLDGDVDVFYHPEILRKNYSKILDK